MPSGRHAKPAEVKRAQGNPGKRQIAEVDDVDQAVASDDQAEAVDVKMPAPDWLTSDLALQIWSSLAPDLQRMRLLKSTDVNALARYCDHMGRWITLKAKVDAKGESYETTSNHGTLQRINPDFAAMLRVEDKMVSIEDRFGMSPSARGRILAQLANSQSGLPLENPTKPSTGEQPASAPARSAVGILNRAPRGGGSVH